MSELKVVPPVAVVKRAVRTLLPGLQHANYVERWSPSSPAVPALSILLEWVGEEPMEAGDLIQPDVPTAHECRPEGRANDDATFIGSSALLTALYETYVAHLHITEPDGPDGPYIWCACGWRSDEHGPNDNPGSSYAVHLTNAQHAAAVKALQPIVTRVTPPGVVSS